MHSDDRFFCQKSHEKHNQENRSLLMKHLV